MPKIVRTEFLRTDDGHLKKTQAVEMLPDDAFTFRTVRQMCGIHLKNDGHGDITVSFDVEATSKIDKENQFVLGSGESFNAGCRFNKVAVKCGGVGTKLLIVATSSKLWGTLFLGYP